jgi:hypothetical protein
MSAVAPKEVSRFHSDTSTHDTGNQLRPLNARSNDGMSSFRATGFTCVYTQGRRWAKREKRRRRMRRGGGGGGGVTRRRWAKPVTPHYHSQTRHNGWERRQTNLDFTTHRRILHDESERLQHQISVFWVGNTLVFEMPTHVGDDRGNRLSPGGRRGVHKWIQSDGIGLRMIDSCERSSTSTLGDRPPVHTIHTHTHTHKETKNQRTTRA